MRRIIIALLAIISLLSAEIRMDRYVDDFGDHTGDKILIISGHQSKYPYEDGKFIIAKNGSVNYRFSGFLTNTTDLQEIVIRTNTGETFKYNVYTADLGDCRQSYEFNGKSKEIIKILKKYAWVKVVVYDFTNKPEMVKIYLNGVTKTLKNYLGL